MCLNHRIKRVVLCWCRTGTLKNPTKCLWRWEPDRWYNFFSPPAHIWLKYRCMWRKTPINSIDVNIQAHDPWWHLQPPDRGVYLPQGCGLCLRQQLEYTGMGFDRFSYTHTMETVITRVPATFCIHDFLLDVRSTFNVSEKIVKLIKINRVWRSRIHILIDFAIWTRFGFKSYCTFSITVLPSLFFSSSSSSLSCKNQTKDESHIGKKAFPSFYDFIQ